MMIHRVALMSTNSGKQIDFELIELKINLVTSIEIGDVVTCSLHYKTTNLHTILEPNVFANCRNI